MPAGRARVAGALALRVMSWFARTAVVTSSAHPVAVCVTVTVSPASGRLMEEVPSWSMLAPLVLPVTTRLPVPVMLAPVKVLPALSCTVSAPLRTIAW